MREGKECCFFPGHSEIRTTDRPVQTPTNFGFQDAKFGHREIEIKKIKNPVRCERMEHFQKVIAEGKNFHMVIPEVTCFNEKTNHRVFGDRQKGVNENAP